MLWVGVVLWAAVGAAGQGFGARDATAARACALKNPQKLAGHLRNILRPRVSGTAENEVVRRYVTSTLERLWGRGAVEVDRFQASTPYGRKSFANVVATAHPAAPQRLVLACHFDSKLIPGKRFLAATDSAFPCAAMLRIAEDLTPALRRQRNPSVTLQLVFFDGEEAFREWTQDDSLYGSTHLANKWRDDGTLNKIKLFLLLDLLGAPGSTIPMFNFGQESRRGYSKLARSEILLRSSGCHRRSRWLTGGRGGRQITFNGNRNAWNRGVSGGIQDDHVPFLQNGMNRIVHLISSPFPAVWHTEDDDAGALDAETMLDITAVLRHFVTDQLKLRL